MGVAAKVSEALTPQKIAHWIDFLDNYHLKFKLSNFSGLDPWTEKIAFLH